MKKTIVLGLTAITLALTSSAARAGDVRFSFHVGLPLPSVCIPAPAPVCTTPVYVAPPVVYVPSGYYHPAPVYRSYYHPKYVRHHVRYYRPHCGY